jgi:hypothetical protein
MVHTYTFKSTFMQTIICRHCGREIRRNKRLKHLQQQYCSDTACQKARKRLFDRNKYHTDSIYRAKKLERSHDRAKNHDGPMARSDYQRAYRTSNLSTLNHFDTSKQEKTIPPHGFGLWLGVSKQSKN